MTNERIYVADMFKLAIKWKAMGVKPYYVKDGVLWPILANSCRNQWGTIYLLTDEERDKATAYSGKIITLLAALDKQKDLLIELFESHIAHNIIPQQ